MLGTFVETPGWEDTFAQVKIDVGKFYASKDNEYPTKAGGKRRINWGWAQVAPSSTQTFPRVITFNAAARTLEQAPIEELMELRGASVFDKKGVALAAGAPVALKLAASVASQAEIVATFTLPKTAATLSVTIGKAAAPTPPGAGTKVGTWQNNTDLPGDDLTVTHHPGSFGANGCQKLCGTNAKCKGWVWVTRGAPAGSGDCCQKSGLVCPKPMKGITSGAKVATTIQCHGPKPASASVVCSVAYAPITNASAPFNEVPVTCSGGGGATLRLLPAEKTLEIRMFSDATIVEGFFQKGRIAMTAGVGLTSDADITLSSSVATTADATAWPLNAIWISEAAMRASPRVYGKPSTN